MKTSMPLGKGSVPRLWVNQCALAYASDTILLFAVPVANGTRPTDVGMMASLDHSIHFHTRKLHCEDWFLLHSTSPWSNRNRGLVDARIFDESGTLLASVRQEGVVRLAKDKSKL